MADYADPENTLVIETTKGNVVIEMRPDLAPGHVDHIKKLAREGAYDGVVFHRVIDGFMAQTGDVKFGNSNTPDFNPSRTGTGGSQYPNIKQEFSAEPHVRGTASMARSQDPNSANSQFFIDLAPAEFLDGQYTVVGQLVEGWEVLNAIKKGDPAANGSVVEPDFMVKVTVQE